MNKKSLLSKAAAWLGLGASSTVAYNDPPGSEPVYTQASAEWLDHYPYDQQGTGADPVTRERYFAKPKQAKPKLWRPWYRTTTALGRFHTSTVHSIANNKAHQLAENSLLTNLLFNLKKSP